jgi:DNA-binding CsgD family transcriptional regulator
VNQTTENFERVGRVIAILSQAQNATDLCRQLVHDPQLGDGSVGEQLYALSNRGVFHLVGTYGIEPFAPGEPLNQFTENPLSHAVETRSIWAAAAPLAELDDAWLSVLPLMKDDVPVGAMVTLSRGDSKPANYGPCAMRMLANAGALYLETLGVKNLFDDHNGSQKNGQDLTERQYEVLLGLAHGETNAEIARHLILSESSIKQETVRLYRALGVGSRAQAVAKAKAIGLIPQAIAPRISAPEHQMHETALQ